MLPLSLSGNYNRDKFSQQRHQQLFDATKWAIPEFASFESLIRVL